MWVLVTEWAMMGIGKGMGTMGVGNGVGCDGNDESPELSVKFFL